MLTTTTGASFPVHAETGHTVTLRSKFVLPINLILLVVVATSFVWERWRLQEAEHAILRARLAEEARFIQAAFQAFGNTPQFALFLEGFCHATDPVTSPEHQVAMVDRLGNTVVSATGHAERRIALAQLASQGEGFWIRRGEGEWYIVRVADEGSLRVVIAESTRAVQGRISATLRGHAGWYLGSGALILVAVNIIMQRTVLRPVRRLFRAAHALEQGRLGVQVDVPSNDELGALSRQFNETSRVLAEQAEAIWRELEAARRVQSHFLPPSAFRLGCLDVAGRCLQLGPVGGDVYDVQLLPDERVALLVADLSGHNVAAALYTALVRAIVWREAEQASSPGEVLARLNQQLCQDLPDEHFATAFFGWFDPRSAELHYANAGHPPAYLRLPTGHIQDLAYSGPLLGIFPDAGYGDAAAPVTVGSVLLVYSDGLTEVSNPQGAMWGTEGLLEWLRSSHDLSPAQAVERLIDRVAEFRVNQQPQDDMTILLARYNPD
jgi:phosphoserine phosphatase RsbU/P